MTDLKDFFHTTEKNSYKISQHDLQNKAHC